MNASKMNVLVSFWKRGDGDDGFGTITPGTGPWAEAFRDYAEVNTRPGTEAQVGGVTAANDPITVRLRYHAGTAALTNVYRVRMVEVPGVSYDVKSAIDPTMKRREMLVTAVRTATA